MSKTKWRVNRREFLNTEDYHSRAYIRFMLQDTSRCRTRTGSPKRVFEIADCSDNINLYFDMRTKDDIENSIYKLETIQSALNEFIVGFKEEVRLLQERKAQKRQKAKP